MIAVIARDTSDRAIILGLWVGPKVAARVPWIACVVQLASYECGMDQPTYTPVQQIRVETIAHYLAKYASDIIEQRDRDPARLARRTSG